MSARAAVPRLLLSGESLLGASRAGREAALGVGRRYADGAVLARDLAAACDAGADGVLLSPSALVRDALARSPGLAVWALLPNVPEYVRDSSDAGLVGAALQRVKRAGPVTLARLALTGLTHAPSVLAGDFAGMLPLLLELEMASLGSRTRGIVVAAPITDLALAGRHRRFFAHVCGFIRARFGGTAGFETHNLGHLLRALRDWDIRPDLVIGPVNPRGLLMKPSAGEVLEELRRTPVPVLAKEVRAGGTVPLAEGARYARAQGVHGLVVDVGDVQDVGAELRSLAG